MQTTFLGWATSHNVMGSWLVFLGAWTAVSFGLFGVFVAVNFLVDFCQWIKALGRARIVRKDLAGDARFSGHQDVYRAGYIGLPDPKLPGVVHVVPASLSVEAYRASRELRRAEQAFFNGWGKSGRRH